MSIRDRVRDSERYCKDKLSELAVRKVVLAFELEGLAVEVTRIFNDLGMEGKEKKENERK